SDVPQPLFITTGFPRKVAIQCMFLHDFPDNWYLPDDSYTLPTLAVRSGTSPNDL
ncbi:MAG: hypothetical protein NXY57DRAFT_907600, partial [Lentinula lateritia]